MLAQVGGGTDLAAFRATLRTTVAGLAATVARSNGWDIVPQAPAMGSATMEAPVVLPIQVVARPPALPAAPAVPASLSAAPSGSNLKLWLYDPRSSAATGLATGIFLRNVTANGPWTFVGAGADGSVYQQLAAGASYEFDVVEPQGGGLQRRRYLASVSATGAVAVQDQNANANGYYAVTVTVPAAVTAEVKLRQEALRLLAERPVSTFRQTSQCQLLDGVTAQRSFATDLSAGFPRVRTRLPSFGQLRSLIIPVDFPEVAGQGDPGSLFTPVVKEVRDFFHKQSYGRLGFEFEILPNWVRLPFNPSKYGFTSVNGSGDFTSYRNDIFAMLDGQVDFSRYDAVYILVPKEMPMSKMGYGPAITGPTWTSTGYVINGATGGADMYQQPGNEWRWMAHETGHAFGLYDEDLDHKTQTLGHWGIMAMNWSRNAIENIGWDRYLLGWLPEEQVACLPKESLASAGTSVALAPLVRQDSGTKAAMVPLSGTKILVMESRKNEGYDRIAAGNEGVLVYTVDMTLGTLKGGYRTVRRPGSVDPNFEDAALRSGESVTVDGVTVTVTASSKDGDTVKISRQ
jgi:M6 family metalloprotease-like protein